MSVPEMVFKRRDESNRKNDICLFFGVRNKERYQKKYLGHWGLTELGKKIDRELQEILHFLNFINSFLISLATL